MASQETSSISGDGLSVSVESPKGQQCLCSPTTHEGSFRCKFHRSNTSANWFKRSKSMPHPPTKPASPRSIDR
ncbi:hypothetical protein F511_33615 [Dorcoceras hygrometricum]|uniref:Uncharacterized protein n=1 Tax=Dorcoceras hygrometricum TaxID=472368 RepID=A0A2Z7D0F5_9LAMI|nr:hypothetical protein F511_33615 [Dorcoceras hygrometricum]